MRNNKNQQLLMIINNLRGYLLFIFMFIANCSSAIIANCFVNNSYHIENERNNFAMVEQAKNGCSVQILEKLNSEFQASISDGDTAKSRAILNLILRNLAKQNNNKLTISNSQYYIGVYYLLSGKNSEAIKWLRPSLQIREELNCHDAIYAKCLFNLGIVYNNLGDFKRMEQYILQSLKIEILLYGESSSKLLGSLSALVTAYIGINEYDRAINYGNQALNLIGETEAYSNSEVAILYINIGACYARLSDYSKAVMYLEQAESIYKKYPVAQDENYINLLNSLAATYYFLGLYEKSDEYFNKGIEKIESSSSLMSFNFLNSFAIILGNSGKAKKGERLMLNSLAKAENYYGVESRDYFEVLKNYAEYLRTYEIDLEKSLVLYEQCLIYIKKHEEDISLKEPVLLGYSLALLDNGESLKALEIIQQLLFSGGSEGKFWSLTDNPGINSIKPIHWSINVLKAKYRILWDLYSTQHKNEYLIAASEASELIIALLEKVRINISEEESRLVLGDRYRDSYLFAIRDFNLCYEKTGNEKFMEKAFVYSEKSKVAGLLASTRELKATQFHIPSDIAELERRLKTEISFYEARISDESYKRSPDTLLVSEWKSLVLTAIQRRDSLINLFEKQYPEYYSFKYNTGVIKPSDIPYIAGRNTNYLNYVVSDTVLYIFLTNRKNMKLVTVPVDSLFFNDIRKFRDLLSMPVSNARSDFIEYMATGSNIYNTVIEPVQKYFISEKLLISPDNILSYIPFEAIPVQKISEESFLFNEIPFLTKEYSISYTYSATLLAESLKRDNGPAKSLIAFAPVYTGSINVDSLLESRQPGKYMLHDLRFARIEAEYVTDLTGGKLLLNDRAKESVFKAEGGNYDIVHLAMHTVLNDQDPMHSKMLFYLGSDSEEDGKLNTYEVYGMQLNAKMVILSSCNTGTGTLNSGEGILSLARGFIYSGSQSVIMSMWEIEDRSGAEIVKALYRYLKKGETKSNALQKARIKYLKSADMLRSHPYFWSSLVIYGNNAPVYHSGKLVIVFSFAGLLICLLLIFYYRRPR